MTARQKLAAQQQENLGVKKVPSPFVPRPSFSHMTQMTQEFSNLNSTAPSPIYKLSGPILLRQSRDEAGLAVDARLDFIGKEL